MVDKHTHTRRQSHPVWVEQSHTGVATVVQLGQNFKKRATRQRLMRVMAAQARNAHMQQCRIKHHLWIRKHQLRCGVQRLQLLD